VFWTSDDLFLLVPHVDVNHVGFTALFMNYTNPAVVTPVRHAFVNGRFDEDSDFLSGFIRSEDPA
jgi:hypothetical protein